MLFSDQQWSLAGISVELYIYIYIYIYIGRADISDQFKRIIICCKRSGYNINITRQSAWLAQSWLITLLPSLIARRWVGRQTQWWPRHKAIYFSWLGPELFCLLLGPPGFNCWFSFAPVFQWCCLTPQGSQGVGRNTLFLSSPHPCSPLIHRLLGAHCSSRNGGGSRSSTCDALVPDPRRVSN